MFRHRSTTASGQPFDQATIDAVWEKSQHSPQHHPLRLDASGALIWKEGYGNTSSKFGWEIDHIKPVTKGGGDELENLQPLQWENNRSKGDTWVNGNRPSTRTLQLGSTTRSVDSEYGSKPATPHPESLPIIR